MKTLSKALMVTVLPALLVVGVILAEVSPTSAQARAKSTTEIEKVDEPGASPGGPANGDNAMNGKPAEAPAKVVDSTVPELAKELELMKARIEQLELQLKAKGTAEQPSTSV